MRQIFILLLSLILLSFEQLSAQHFPQGYFRNSLDIPILLAGNYGECRPNHFHSGIDIKTNQKENLPVYAAADGYISRINISHSGYGNALYINHPNGFQTVYAHLNKYNDAIEKYIASQQQLQEKWNIDIQLPPDLFPVKKGELVAFSGNTGGSTAPHLHLEIRDIATEEVLNPLLFGFDIKDNLAPEIQQIAIYDASQSIYDQKPIFIALHKKENLFVPKTDTIKIPFKEFRIGVLAEDKMNGSNSSLACYAMHLSQDGNRKISWQLFNLSFEKTRYVNAFADFKTYMNQKDWFVGLYKLPHNELNIYEGENGVLSFSNTDFTQVHIQAKDALGNTSLAQINLQFESPQSSPKPCENNPLEANWQQATFKFSCPQTLIYDPFCWEIKPNNGNALAYEVQIMDRDVPLHNYADLSLKLKTILPFHLRSKLYFIHQIKKQSLPGANAQPGMAAQYDNGWVSGKIRTFGKFEVGIDTIPPSIKILSSKKLKANPRIKFQVTEKETSFTSCKAWIDGIWYRFSRVGNTFSLTDERKLNAGNHVLKIQAMDENENEALVEWPFVIQ